MARPRAVLMHQNRNRAARVKMAGYQAFMIHQNDLKLVPPRGKCHRHLCLPAGKRNVLGIGLNFRARVRQGCVDHEECMWSPSSAAIRGRRGCIALRGGRGGETEGYAHRARNRGAVRGREDDRRTAKMLLRHGVRGQKPKHHGQAQRDCGQPARQSGTHGQARTTAASAPGKA